MKKWVYITTYNRIIELFVDEKAFASLIKSWQNKKALALNDMNNEPLVLDGNYQILTETQYESFIVTSRQEQFIKKGTWFDSKEKEVIRHEPWKQKQIDNALKIQNSSIKNSMTHEQWKRQKKLMVEMLTNKK